MVADRAGDRSLRQILDVVDDLLPCDRKEGCRRPNCRYCTTPRNRVKQKSELLSDQHQRETDTLENPSKPGFPSKSPNTRLVKSAMRTTERTHYSDDLKRGFVVRSTAHYPATKTKPAWRHTSWWYGPGHGFGTTFGTLDYCVQVFPSRQAAQHAIDTGYMGASAHRMVIETVSEARRILAVSRARVS